MTVRSNVRRIDSFGSRSSRKANERRTRSVGSLAPGRAARDRRRSTDTRWLVADPPSATSTWHIQPLETGRSDVDASQLTALLTARAPEREPGQLDALPARAMSVPHRRHGRPARRRPRATGRPRLAARRRDPFGTRARRSAFASRSRRAVATSRARVASASSPTRRPRVDPLDEQHLALVDVADPGQRPLVEQGLGDRRRRPGRVAQPAERLVRPAGSKSGASRSGPSAATPGGAPRPASRTARRPGRRSRPRPRPAPRARAAPGRRAGATRSPGR